MYFGYLFTQKSNFFNAYQTLKKHKIKNGNVIFVEKAIEIVCPVLFCTCAKVFRDVHETFFRSKTLPRGNLVVSFIGKGLDLFTALSVSHGHMRHQPTMNKAIPYSCLRSILCTMLEAVRLCKSKPQTSYKVRIEKFTGQYGIRDLIGGHLIVCMSLLRLLPTHVALQATISKITLTQKRLKRL